MNEIWLLTNSKGERAIAQRVPTGEFYFFGDTHPYTLDEIKKAGYEQMLGHSETDVEYAFKELNIGPICKL